MTAVKGEVAPPPPELSKLSVIVAENMVNGGKARVVISHLPLAGMFKAVFVRDNLKETRYFQSEDDAISFCRKKRVILKRFRDISEIAVLDYQANKAHCPIGQRAEQVESPFLIFPVQMGLYSPPSFLQHIPSGVYDDNPRRYDL